MSPSARPFLIAALLAGALSWAPLAQAQTATPEAPANLEELQRLERSLRDLAEQAGEARVEGGGREDRGHVVEHDGRCRAGALVCSERILSTPMRFTPAGRSFTAATKVQHE